MSESPLRPWLLRPARLLDLAVVAAMLLVVAGLFQWRQGQFTGHGLQAVYYPGRDFNGKALRRAVEPRIDFSNKTHAHFKRPVFSAEWTGSIYLPRSGRYGFSTESDDASWLFIDDTLVVDNGGVHGLRRREGVRILPRGLHRIKIRYFQAGAGASLRVFWSPAGRRGGLEYIPPTLLFPVPPRRASHATAYAVPPRDLPAVAGMGACLLLGLLLLARGQCWRLLRDLRRRGEARTDLAALVLLFGGALLYRLWDMSAAGQTWDEDVYWATGRNFIQNFLFGDTRAASWVWNNEHPALAKWLYGPATLAGDTFEPARLVSLVLGALTCAVVYLAGRDLLGRRVALIGAALCALLPHIVAHHKIIGLETPTGLFYTLAVWLFWRAERVNAQANNGLHLLTGVSVGLLVATRVSNSSVLVVLLALYLLRHRQQILQTRHLPMSLTRALIPVVAAAVFIGLWPYLWENPMKHVGVMLSHWDPDKYLEWFLGKKQLPHWYYFPLYFAVTTPVVALGALGLALGRLFRRRDAAHFYLLVWFLAPWVVALSPLARDGVRYLYPALFPACLLMAAGLDWLASGAARALQRPGAATPLVAVLGTALGLYVFHAGSTVHPYYLDYYNELTGGPAEVARTHQYEIGWWGEGLKEANAHVSRVAPRGARVMIYCHPAHVVHLREDLEQVSWVELADYIIFNDLFNDRPKSDKHRVTYVVRAAGAPLAWVYERQGLANPARPAEKGTR